MAEFVLAQLNIAKMRYSIDASEMTDFVANLDRINALAEKSPGFVWRFVGDEALEKQVFGPGILVNFSTWTDLDSLRQFVFFTAHKDIMRRRKEWFDRLDTYSVMWWHHNDLPPDLAEAQRRLQKLAGDGPGEDAFTFKNAYPNTQLTSG